MAHPVHAELKDLVRSLPIESIVREENRESIGGQAFTCNSVFSPAPTSAPKPTRSPEIPSVTTEAPVVEIQEVQYKNPIIDKIDTEVDIFQYKPETQVYKEWREAIFRSPITSDKFEKARLRREYSYMKAIQSVLNIKSGHLIRFLNYISDSTSAATRQGGKIEKKFRAMVGQFPKIRYANDDTLQLEEKLDRLEKDLKQEIYPGIQFENAKDVQMAIHHLEYKYGYKLRQKVFGIYLGIFWFICPMSKRECPFEMKFTRKNVNQLIVLERSCFKHNHDPWNHDKDAIPPLDMKIIEKIKNNEDIFDISLIKEPSVIQKILAGESRKQYIEIIDDSPKKQKTKNEDCVIVSPPFIVKKVKECQEPVVLDLTSRLIERVTKRKNAHKEAAQVKDLTLPTELISELRLKSIHGEGKKNLVSYALQKVIPDRDPTSAEKSKIRSSVIGIISDANTKHMSGFHLENLKNMISTKFNEKVECIDIPSNNTSNVLIGIIAKIKVDSSVTPYLVPGHFMVTNNISLKTIFKAETIIFYQLDKFQGLQMKYVVILQKFDNLAFMHLLQILKREEEFKFFLCDHHGPILACIKDMQTLNPEIKYRISKEVIMDEFYKHVGLQKDIILKAFIAKIKTFLSSKDYDALLKFLNSDFKAQLETKAKEDSKSRKIFTFLIENFTDLFRNLDRRNEVGFFPKNIFSKYYAWVRETSQSTNKDFCQSFKFLLEDTSLNTFLEKGCLRDVIGYRAETIQKLFTESGSLLNTEQYTGQRLEETILILELISKYSPSVTRKIMQSYIISEHCKVIIPNVFEEIKQIMEAEERGKALQMKTEILVLEHDYKKNGMLVEFKLNPQTLKCSCGRLSLTGITCCHVIAYLLKGINLKILEVLRNGYLISQIWEIDNQEKIAAKYLLCI
ncbi:unnamed protein product [Moneuplotes crassus]|uniref:SWIM-type domain-containing protein n=1 Tax=Euplotes crassus TaxID=5936 RepID=A0AAD1XNI2_EUPCR|nr:unnamed protein product [Moneuplotes crassus]